MKKQFKLGVIGCGFSAQSILKGVVLSDFIHEKKIIVSEDNDEAFGNVEFLGIRRAPDNRFVIENSEYVLLDVKAQKIDEVLKSFGGIAPSKLISVVSGVRKNVLKNALGTGAVNVARCLPNLPCAIGSGVIGIDMSDFNNNTDDIEFISNVFNCVGTVLSVDESKMDAVSGLGYSGPVYALMFIDSLTDAGVENGLSKNEAKILAVQTLMGVAEMVERDEQTLSELVKLACTHGGTAIEAVKVFEDKNFRGIIGEAVSACVKRSKELSDK